MKTSKPGLVLMPDMIACGVHRQVFRPAWPKGWPTFSIEGLKRINLGTADPGKMRILLLEKPICCRLAPDDLRDLYMKCEVGSLHICEDCGNARYGVPFDMVIDGQLVHLNHMCFRCITSNVRSIHGSR